MNRLGTAKRVQVISALVEGSSINAIVRMTGVAKHTILNLPEDTECACAACHHRHVRGLRARRIQCDEIWQFVGGKAKNATPEQKVAGCGDVWTWVALDAHTKLCISYLPRGRDTGWAKDFTFDIRQRVVGRPQITTDAHKPYMVAIEMAFGENVDYAQMHKIYGTSSDSPESRYSPATCIGCDMKLVIGDPDPKHVSTSSVERQNWSLRTSVRRMTRLSNGFSRKARNHGAAIALNYFAYDFIKIHSTLRTSTAMAAGVTDRLWDVSDLVTPWETYEMEAERAA